MATLLLAVGLSACGSSGSSSSTAASGSGGGSKTSAGPSASGGASAKSAKVCELLPVADVAKFSGLPLTKAADETLPGTAAISKCKYTSADGTQEISVSTFEAGDTDAAKKALSEQAGVMGGKKVSGVGDLAYFSPQLGVGGLTVLYGGTHVSVAATQDIRQDVAVKIAEALHARM